MLSKRLASGLEGREPVAIILDDSSVVWPHDLRNLLVVERYIYLPTVRTKGRPTLFMTGRWGQSNVGQTLVKHCSGICQIFVSSLFP